MSLQHFSVKDVTTGLPKDVLAGVTWRQVAELVGLNRARVLNDLEKYDIRVQVRLNPDELAAFRPGATGLVVNLGDVEGDVLFTTEWTSLRPSTASLLDRRRHEEANLGAQGQEMTSVSDGYGGKTFHPFPTRAFPDLWEFRLPCEVPVLAVATK